MSSIVLFNSSSCDSTVAFRSINMSYLWAGTQLFAKEGASVTLDDRNKPKQEAQDLIDAGYEAISSQCDVSDEKAVEAMVAKTVDTFEN